MEAVEKAPGNADPDGLRTTEPGTPSEQPKHSCSANWRHRCTANVNRPWSKPTSQAAGTRPADGAAPRRMAAKSPRQTQMGIVLGAIAQLLQQRSRDEKHS